WRRRFSIGCWIGDSEWIQMQPPRRRGRRGRNEKGCMGRKLKDSFNRSGLAVLAPWRFYLCVVFFGLSFQTAGWPSRGFGAVYHVSPAGDDSGAGDAGNPFLTISHAAELAG